MKVVHVVRQYLPSIGGMEEVVRSLAASQRASGVIQPSIVTLDRVFRDPENILPEIDEIEGVPITRLKYKGSERYPLAPAVLSAIRHADVVHVHGIDFLFDFLAFTRSIHGKPLIASTHGGFFHTSFASMLKKVFFNTVTRLNSKGYVHIIATSENDGLLFGKITSAPRLRVIENGVDIEKFNDAASADLKPVLIYFGRWSENKGLVETLETFAALTRQAPDTSWRLIIAGREYDLTARSLRDQAQRLGIENLLQVHASPSQQELRTLLGQASYFICQSRHEGFGIAPIEAMSAGLIPILSDIPPFRKLLTETGQGVLLESKTLEGRAYEIQRLHEERLCGVSVRLALMRSVQKYAWDGVADKYAQAYQKAVGAG